MLEFTYTNFTLAKFSVAAMHPPTSPSSQRHSWLLCQECEWSSHYPVNIRNGPTSCHISLCSCYSCTRHHHLLVYAVFDTSLVLFIDIICTVIPIAGSYWICLNLIAFQLKPTLLVIITPSVEDHLNGATKGATWAIPQNCWIFTRQPYLLTNYLDGETFSAPWTRNKISLV